MFPGFVLYGFLGIAKHLSFSHSAMHYTTAVGLVERARVGRRPDDPAPGVLAHTRLGGSCRLCSELAGALYSLALLNILTPSIAANKPGKSVF